MSSVILDGNEIAFWNQFVLRHSQGSVYNLGEWLKLFRQTYNFPYYCIVKKDSERIVAGLSVMQTNSLLFGRKLVTNPFSLYSSILYRDADDCRYLLDSLIQLGHQQKVKLIELRCYNKIPDEILNLYHIQELRTRVIPVVKLQDSYKETFKNYKDQFRTNIKAIRENLQNDGNYTVYSTDNIEDFKNFYNMLLRLFKDKHLMFPPPFKFFTNLLYIFPKNYFSLYILKYKTKVIAGIVMLFFKNYSYYSWSASNINFNKVNVTAFLLDYIIQEIHERKIKYLDLGVTSPENYNLLFFKTRWGSELTRPYLYLIPLGEYKFRDYSAETSFKTYRKVIRYMPLFLFKRGADIIYKHLT